MIPVATIVLFAAANILIWRRDSGAALLAYALASVVAVLTITMLIVTGLLGLATSWRHDAAQWGMGLTFAFVLVGIYRS